MPPPNPPVGDWQAFSEETIRLRKCLAVRREEEYEDDEDDEEDDEFDDEDEDEESAAALAAVPAASLPSLDDGDGTNAVSEGCSASRMSSELVI